MTNDTSSQRTESSGKSALSTSALTHDLNAPMILLVTQIEGQSKPGLWIESFSRHFPPELHVLFVNELDRKSVFQYSLACRAFHANAVHQIWSEIPLRIFDTSETQLLRDCALITKSRSRGPFVRSLKIRVLPNTEQRRLGAIRMSFPGQVRIILRDALGAIPNVRTLAMSGASSGPLDNGLISRVVLPELGIWAATISLTSLTWDGFSLSDMTPILSVSPKIAKLQCGEKFDGQDFFGAGRTEIPSPFISIKLLPQLEHLSSVARIIHLFLAEARALRTLRISDRLVRDEDCDFIADHLPMSLQCLIVSSITPTSAFLFVTRSKPSYMLTRLVLKFQKCRPVDFTSPVVWFLNFMLNDMLRAVLLRFPSLHVVELSTNEMLSGAPYPHINETRAKPNSNDESHLLSSPTLKEVQIFWHISAPRDRKRSIRSAQKWIGREGWKFLKDERVDTWNRVDIAQGYDETNNL